MKSLLTSEAMKPMWRHCDVTCDKKNDKVWINPLHAEMLQKDVYAYYYHFFSLKWYRMLKSFLKEGKNLPSCLALMQWGRDKMATISQMTFSSAFFNENVWIPIKISLKFVPKGPINNITALVQIMPRRHPGQKALSELMMVSLMTHKCVIRPQWIKSTPDQAADLWHKEPGHLQLWYWPSLPRITSPNCEG